MKSVKEILEDQRAEGLILERELAKLAQINDEVHGVERILAKSFETTHNLINGRYLIVEEAKRPDIMNYLMAGETRAYRLGFAYMDWGFNPQTKSLSDENHLRQAIQEYVASGAVTTTLTACLHENLDRPSNQEVRRVQAEAFTVTLDYLNRGTQLTSTSVPQTYLLEQFARSIPQTIQIVPVQDYELFNRIVAWGNLEQD